MKRMFLNSTARAAEAVLTARTQFGWSQTDLAKTAGVELSYVQDLERGDRRLDLAPMLRILEVLEIHATALPPPPEPKPADEVNLDEVVKRFG